MNNRSSKKQQQLLEFIDDFIKQHGYGPSYREIMSGLGYKSVSTVAVHVNGLLTKGYIRKKDNSARSIEVVTLRHGAAAEPATRKTSEHMVWLEEEISTRIAQPDETSESIETLITAAGLLGSTNISTLRNQLAQRSKQ